MHVFVAGATGALGRPLVRQLVARGHQVTGLTRTPGKVPGLEALGATPAVADALDVAAITAAVGQAAPEVIVHALTALPPQGPRRARDLDATNRLRTLGTDNLLAAARAARVGTVVAESIALVYGPQPEPATEATPRAAHDPTGLVGEAIRAVAHLEDAVLGVGGAVLRFGLFYGPGAGTEQMAAALRRRRLPAPALTCGALPWIHTEDAAAAAAAAVERAAPGQVYNVVDDEPLGMREFIHAVARAAGAPRPTTIPTSALRLVAPYTAAIAALHLPVSNAKARRELGWAPTHPTVQSGLGHSLGVEGGQHAR